MTDSGVVELFQYLRENTIHTDNVSNYFLNKSEYSPEFEYEYENFDEFEIFEFEPNELEPELEQDIIEPSVIIGKNHQTPLYLIPQQYKSHYNHLSNEELLP